MPATTKACDQCGDDFPAYRSTAKYCGDRCRKQARRRASRSEAEAIVPGLSRIVARTESELTKLGQLETVLGDQALILATRMTSMKDTGSAIAALSRELDRVMLRIRQGNAVHEDEVSAARRRRDEKRQQATAAAGQA